MSQLLPIVKVRNRPFPSQQAHQNLFAANRRQQNGITYNGRVYDVDTKATQLAEGGIVEQKGVILSEPSVNSEPKVRQLAKGKVVTQDPVIKANSG